MSVDVSTRVIVTIDPASDSDAQEVYELTHRLMAELEAVPGIEVGRVPSGPAPSGSKGDAFSLGQLGLTLLGSGGALTGTVGLVRTWLTQQNANSVELKCGDVSIKIKGKWTEDQQRMIDEWINRIEQRRKAPIHPS